MASALLPCLLRGLGAAQLISSGLQRLDPIFEFVRAAAERGRAFVQAVEAVLAGSHVDDVQRLAACPHLDCIAGHFVLVRPQHPRLLAQVFSRRRARIPPVDSAGYRHHRGQARCD